MGRKPEAVVRGHGPRLACFAAPYWLAPQLQPMLQLLSHSALWALHPSSQLSVPELSSQLSLHV